jgi:phosphohistidine phosphatase SixA
MLPDPEEGTEAALIRLRRKAMGRQTGAPGLPKRFRNQDGVFMRPDLASIPRVLLAALLLLAHLPSPAQAQGSDGWEALRRPGAIALMRHALAPGTGDPANFTLGDCSTQRNLNDAGRQQARAVGAAFRAAGIEVERVLTSQWCRCRETAELLDLASVEALPSLNSFFADRSSRNAQTETTREFLATLPKDGHAVLVTHQVNITALTGLPVSSGEIIVVEVGNDGAVEVLGEILIRP